LFTSEVLVDLPTGLHGCEGTRVSLSCPANWTRSRTFLLRFFRKA
jgi:hypothetical protein